MKYMGIVNMFVCSLLGLFSGIYCSSPAPVVPKDPVQNLSSLIRYGPMEPLANMRVSSAKQIIVYPTMPLLSASNNQAHHPIFLLICGDGSSLYLDQARNLLRNNMMLPNCDPCEFLVGEAHKKKADMSLLRECLSNSHYKNLINTCGAKSGFSPLCSAISAGLHENARMLIDAGALLNLSDNDGFTPFMRATINGDLSLMELLYEREKEDERIKMINATNSTYSKITDDIVNSQDHEKGWNALCLAVWQGNPRIVSFLVEKGADQIARALSWARERFKQQNMGHVFGYDKRKLKQMSKEIINLLEKIEVKPEVCQNFSASAKNNVLEEIASISKKHQDALDKYEAVCKELNDLYIQWGAYCKKNIPSAPDDEDGIRALEILKDLKEDVNTLTKELKK